MESQYQKWVNLCYLAVSALIAFILFSYGMKAANLFEFESKLRGMGVRVPLETLMPVISLMVGGLVGFLLYRNDKANLYLNEVVSELSRVTWPTQKETTHATFIVLIMVLISGMVLGFLDFLWVKVLQKLL